MANWHENTFSRSARIVVRTQPVEPAVHADVPWVAHPPGIQFEIVTSGAATKYTSFFFALVHRMVALGISFLGVDFCQRVFGGVIRFYSLQVSYRLWGVE